MKQLFPVENQFDTMSAIRALRSGMQVRFAYWPSSYYIELNDDEIQASPDEFREYLLTNPMMIANMFVAYNSKCWERYQVRH